MKILIDNGHGADTPWKCSPDRRLLEYKWCRETAIRIERELTRRGADAQRIVVEDSDVAIKERCRRVNRCCDLLGAKNVLLVSIHNNAGADNDPGRVKDKYGSWKTARGWSVFVSKSASEQSKEMARLLTDEAIARKIMGNRCVPAEKYWTWSWTDKDIGILKGTKCPAVLTENLFQDNREDVDWLLTETGRQTITDLHVSAICKYITKYAKT